MDSPIVAQLFRQLFRQPALGCCASLGPGTRRPYSRRVSVDRGMKPNESRWQQRTHVLPEDRGEEFAQYPTVSLRELHRRRERPRRVKMLLRDFIDDSLYNPFYGYFSKQAVIFTPGEPFDFGSMRDEVAFQAELGRRYTAFEDGLDATARRVENARQLWHTPTELFVPHYGEAIARYLIANYRMTTYPYHDLVIYEMGAGRGTLMLNILDYIRSADPQVYARTRFNIIEISPSLAALQLRHLSASTQSRGHADRVEIINCSIFDWNRYVSDPCFFLAMEVFDNFAHDAIRYELASEEPLQAHVLIDAQGEFYEFYMRTLDPLAARFFRVRQAATCGLHARPYITNPWLRRLAAKMPLTANLSDPEFIPTRLMQFFDVLEKYFPAHRLLTSDFDSLPQAIKGLNAPVVQTRYKRQTVPVTTPLVHQGYFDILFPTDFCVTEAMYRAITGKLTCVMSHEDFMRIWACLSDTETRSGENPLLSHYKNASVMVTI